MPSVTDIAPLVLPTATFPKPSAFGVMVSAPSNTWKLVGSEAPPTPGSSVSALALFTASPVVSNCVLPWLLTTLPPAAAEIDAGMVSVTDSPGSSAPFQATGLTPAADTVPEVALGAPTERSPGSVSVNSSPALSSCAPLPLLVMTTV